MKPLIHSTIFNIIFTFAAGCLFHFFYEWSGSSPYLAPFVPINESTWEHLKLLFFPGLIAVLTEACFLRKTYPGLLFYRFIGMCAGLLAVPVLFYPSTGILGRHVLWANILCFAAGVLITFCLSCRLTKRHKERHTGNFAALLGFLALAGLFILFTYWQPPAGIFVSPV